MTIPTQGLVIGKFYPPHNGHIALIEHAATACDRLAVLVLASQFESISLEQRVEWLRSATASNTKTANAAQAAPIEVIGILSDAPVDYDSDIAWDANFASIHAALANAGIDNVDAVISSEPYGTQLATRFGASPIVFDQDRTRHPISGTLVRQNLPDTWQHLPAATRLGLATRVIVVGAESTGSTTLTEALVGHYRAQHPFRELASVEEYGRHFTYELAEQKQAEATAAGEPAPTMDDLVWTTEHFGHIASVQNDWEDAAALACPLIIADTDALATTLWERRYMGEHSQAAKAVVDARLPRRDVYLITDHEGVDFYQDGWRDGEHIRPTMTRWFIEELTRRGLPWVLLRGDRDTRLRYSIELIDALWQKNTRFDSPPWATATKLESVAL